MPWERFFEDLEDQLDSEWEAERAALDTEAERLRLARLTLRQRLVALTDGGQSPPRLELADGDAVTGRLAAVGADWIALTPDTRRAGAVLVPLAAVVAIGMPHADVLRSARADVASTRLAERMTFGFVLRDLVRRRTPLTVTVLGGRTLSGTIDRAGADHLDLALHDRGQPRRSGLVTGHRLIPFSAVVAVRLDAPAPLP
ncbi:hypothetical protein [uncultured Microbacterium sp.]|uniref:Uncharacterized protein n=1 Tax=uncultured Microbacterium sp. TaxID=191216 RepID=A0A1Y5P6T4_9MICO|nr:hypothetical protein [uncultured Microbacterium sp.]SBS74406.1 conserved hypothetical protein [uncultured Microbacterium sp.]